MTNKIEIVDETTLQTLTDKTNAAKNVVFGASKPLEMVEALDTLVGIKETIRLAKAELKKIEEDPKAKIKELENAFKVLESEIKTKTLETYKETIKQKINSETGEVINSVVNNLGKKKYTYTPESTKIEIDKKRIAEIGQITYEYMAKEMDIKYIKYDYNIDEKMELIDIYHIVKEVKSYVVDEAALADYIERNGTNGLPTKIVKKEASVGIQYAQILNELRNKPKGVE